MYSQKGEKSSPAKTTLAKLKANVNNLATKKIKAQVQPDLDKKPITTTKAKAKIAGHREI